MRIPTRYIVRTRYIAYSVFAVAALVAGYFLFAPSTHVPKDATERSGKHSIPLEEIVDGGPGKDGIPSIDDPKFTDVAEGDRFIKPDSLGISLTLGGETRFYPYQILTWHEVVNDRIGGRPILVTYCPLCATGIVFDRKVDDEPVEFGVSGKLHNNNLLMYDRKTESYWSQVRGEAVVGEKTGTKLTVLPAETIAWKDWKAAHPSGKVLSRDTGRSRDYERDPYGGYAQDSSLLFPLSHQDDRLDRKELVVGVKVGDRTKAYSAKALARERVRNDTVGGEPLLAVSDPAGDVARVFRRAVDGTTLSFRADGAELLDDRAGRWSFDGAGTAGSARGKRLETYPSIPALWFSWAATYPKTGLFK